MTVWLSQYSSKPKYFCPKPKTFSQAACTFASVFPQQFILKLYHWYDAISCSYIAPIKSNISIASDESKPCVCFRRRKVQATHVLKYFSNFSHIFLLAKSAGNTCAQIFPKYFCCPSADKQCEFALTQDKCRQHMWSADQFYRDFLKISQRNLKYFLNMYFCCLLVCVCLASRRMQATHVLSWSILHVHCAVCYA